VRVGRSFQVALHAAQGVDMPVIDQTMYAQAHSMAISPDFLIILKVGPYHSGFGKIRLHVCRWIAQHSRPLLPSRAPSDPPSPAPRRVQDRTGFDDMRSIVATHADYCTAERFVDYDYDIRIQKIGPHIRAFRRQSPNWKANTGNASINEDTEVTPLYRRWIEECGRLWGGLDICALDAVHDRETGKDVCTDTGTAQSQALHCRGTH
jgi:synapsin